MIAETQFSEGIIVGYSFILLFILIGLMIHNPNKNKITLIISGVALCVSFLSAYYSHEANKISKNALKLSETINTPFLDVRLAKFKSGAYYTVKKNGTLIDIKVQFECANTGNVPITLTSLKMLNLEVESQETIFPEHELSQPIIISPKTSRFYQPTFPLHHRVMQIEELYEFVNSNDFHFVTEWKFLYHSDINKDRTQQIVVGYKITKDTATIIKSER